MFYIVALNNNKHDWGCSFDMLKDANAIISLHLHFPKKGTFSKQEVNK